MILYAESQLAVIRKASCWKISMEKLLHQMEKEINFLHEKLKSMNTIITFLLENVVKLRDNHNNENSSIHSNNDVKITQ